ncbi:hypothetical protein P3W45_000175 [Vairimorpha bombi]|jgi:ribonuclease H2 subunit A
MDRLKNHLFSNLKESNRKVVVGIDEAGRGPVLGYLVYCIMVFEINDIPEDVRDSKVLTDKRRRYIFDKLKGRNFAYKALHPAFITSQMESLVNLNNISWYCVFELISLVVEKYSNIEGIYIDAIGDCSKFKSFLQTKFDHEFFIEPKADGKYPVVSGASIVAKVVRDDKLLEFGLHIGSGYPSDPITKNWLSKSCNKVFGWGECVRYTWGTAKNILGYNKSKQYTGRLSGFYIHPE